MRLIEAMATDVRTVTTDEGVAAAARAMRDAGTGFLPVLEGGRAVGVVTDRDLVVRFLADGGTDAEGTLVGDVMTRDVTTLGADQDLEAAATLMRERQVRRLVVTDADGVVVGVLSHGDLVQATDGEGAGREATLGVTEGAQR
ncbi:MAG TPA: CBS domain-containing protein [Miltoncostaeaceae bacterium]|jgi:CBS domain-containing protein|nr:CBS domain-containing protein [Miltoncostaeaceae bacterium]